MMSFYMLSHCQGVDGKEVLEKGKKSHPLFLLNNSVDHEKLKDFFSLVKIEAVTKNPCNLLWRRAQKVFFVKTYETLKTCQAATLTNQVSTFFHFIHQ